MEHKPFKTIDEQIAILRDERGLVINDLDCAKHALTELNYYRLSGYTLTLRKNNKFYPRITFDDVLQIYYFDRDLRFLLLNYLEDIEISLRTHLGYVLGEQDSESTEMFAYLNESTYAAPEVCKSILDEIRKSVSDNSSEAFVKHHRTKYGGLLPAWAMVETLSFGKASKLFSSLNTGLQKRICNDYYNGRRYKVMNNWFEGLVVLRNMCAHKIRLINRGITYKPNFSNEDDKYLESQGYERNQIGNRLFFRLIIIARISPDPNIVDRIKTDIDNLCEIYPFVDLKHYGFLHNWKEILEHLSK